MCSTRVLGLLALLVGLTHSFSWDIIQGTDRGLSFFFNGTKIMSSYLNYDSINAITYDPVHDRVLVVSITNSVMALVSFDLSTKKTQILDTRRITGHRASVAYDPVKQLLFWRDVGEIIYSISLNPAYRTRPLQKPLVKLNKYIRHIAVDSCRRYIYWVTDSEVGRAWFDGSRREVLIDSHVYRRLSVAIDQQTQKIYWTETIQANGEYQLHIKSANFYGKDIKTLDIVRNQTHGGSSLATSKDFVYWEGENPNGIWQLPKNPPHHGEAKLYSSSSLGDYLCQRIVANYTIAEQTWRMPSCNNLRFLKPKSASIDVNLFCVHGTRVSGESRCECTQGYTGERCDVSMCHNYCLQGDCSVRAEERPTCSCEAGYSGERCEVNACHQYCLNKGVCSLNEEDEAVCECTADYDGERCEISACKDNCTSVEGETKFRCISVERKDNACHQYCLNDGICSLNEDNEPVCQCTEDYEGERCDVPAILIKCYAYNMDSVDCYTNYSPPELKVSPK